MVRLKQAATLLLKSKHIGYPPLSFWQYGKGRSVAHSSDWTPGGGTDVMRWEYYPDYVANIAYLACQEEIPQDAQLMHQLRTSFLATRSRLTSVVDTINFAERFGANTNKIERRLAEVREMVQDAESLYVRHQYDSARETIRRIDQLIIKLQEQAIQIKDRALFWIYVVEWSVTTGTALLAGLGLWALMVRRKLYREVETTRSAGCLAGLSREPLADRGDLVLHRPRLVRPIIHVEGRDYPVVPEFVERSVGRPDRLEYWVHALRLHNSTHGGQLVGESFNLGDRLDDLCDLFAEACRRLSNGHDV